MDKRANDTFYIDHEIGLLELFGEQTLDELLEAISKVTGLGIVISDYTGKPISEMVNFTRFCQKMRTSNSCQLSDASGLAQATALQRHFIYCCPCGLLEVVIPIIIDHRYLGGFLAGQVRCKNIPDSVPRMQVLSDSGNFLDDASCVEAYDEIPFYDFKTFCDISELIYHIVTLLGEKSMANIRNFQVEKDKLIRENHNLTLKTHSLQSKLDAISQKYDPLFLYNVLTDISNMAYLEGAQSAYDMINHLAAFLRGQSEDMVTVKNEADYLNNYLEIFRIKYTDLFQYDVLIDKKVESKQIPANLILPFFKRDIRELLEHRSNGVYLKVEVRQEDRDIRIAILIRARKAEEAADGSGARSGNKKAKRSRYLSLEGREVIKRLELMYEEAFNCLVEGDVTQGTQITLRFPVYNL